MSALSRPLGAVSYVAVLRTPGAARAFAASTVVRLSYGTVLLSLLLTVQTVTGSFGAAGAALGALGVPAVLLPVKSRAVDRYGRRRVLAPLGIAYASTLGLIAAAAGAGVRQAALYVVLSATAGLLTPPVGPIMRSIWATLAPEPGARQQAYALDSVVEESVFAGAPVLVGVIVAVTQPLVALVVTAVLALVGTLGLATSALAELPLADKPAGRRGLLGPLASQQLRWVLLVMLVVGVGLSPLELAVAARATSAGHPAAAGYLLATLSVGSAAGGLLWGRLRHSRPYFRQLLALLTVLATGTAVAGLVPTLPALGAVLALTGLAVAPCFVVAYLAADLLTDPDMRTEATTWVATASNLGGAAGAAAAGYVIDRTSADIALLSAGAALAVFAAALAALRVRHTDTTASAPDGEVREDVRAPGPWKDAP